MNGEIVGTAVGAGATSCMYDSYAAVAGVVQPIELVNGPLEPRS